MKFIQRTSIYIGIMLLFAYLNPSTPFVWYSMIILAVILTLANYLIRPIINILCLPVSILTLGIASIFINMLTIVIANAISGHVLNIGFWGIALLAVIVMITDTILRVANNKMHKKQEA